MNFSKNTLRNVQRTTIFSILGCGTLLAAPIDLTDPSFELNSGGDMTAGGWNNDLFPDWEGLNGPNSGEAFEEYIGGFFSDGTDHVGMATGYYIWQDTGVSFEPNTTYQLTVGVGNRNAGFSPAGNVSVYAILNSAENLGLNLFSTADVLLDPAVIAYETFDANIDAPIGTFVDAAPLQFTTTDAVPAGTIVVLLGDNSSGGRSHFDNVRLETVIIGDNDEDGLPTQWEIDNGLDDSDDGSVNPANGPDGDPDDDGRTNKEELDSKTLPNKADSDDDGLNDGQEESSGTNPLIADTDGDGLKDGVESNTGTFVGASDTGTDPLDADTDGDGLKDGVESNTGIFVGLADSGTNPLDADTDKDGRSDSTEISNGSNPVVFEEFDSSIIAVGDSSFEGNALNAGGWGNNLSPEWEDRDGENNGGSFEEYIDGFAAEGTDHVGMATGYYIWQDTGVSILPNTNYRLSVSVGNRNANYSIIGNQSTYALLSTDENLGVNGNLFSTFEVLNDPALLASASWDAGENVPEGTFAAAPPLEFKTGAVVPKGTLVILLGDNSPSGRSHFDNVNLEIVGPTDTTPRIEQLAFDIRNGFIDFDAANLVPGRNYHIASATGLSGFVAIEDSEFEASGSTEEVSVEVDFNLQPKSFIRIVEGPVPAR
tara:strand:- start:132 stop:2093 length:1962 start_codon:yes stop_codon:yes gene_type:complete